MTASNERQTHCDDGAGQGSETHRKPGTPSIRSLGIGLLIAGSAASPLAMAGNISVTEEVHLAAPPSRTWAVLKDFAGWQAWHPAFVGTDIIEGAGNARGTVRVLTAKDGATFTEELVSHDSASRSYEYRITKSPLPISNYLSKLQVREDGYGSSVVVWSSTFDVNGGAPVDEMKKTIAGVYRAGLDNLAAVLKRSQPY